MSTINKGDVFKTNSGASVTVLTIDKAPYYLVKYNDSTKHIQQVIREDLISGKLRNPYSPSVFGKGYVGEGKYVSSNRATRKKTPEYQAWKDMLRRCYSTGSSANNSAYVNVQVCDEWLNYQVFSKWFCSNKFYGKGYHLDKDLLIPGSKVYSPKTCCMLPPNINRMLITKKVTDGKEEPQGIHKTPSGKYTVTVSGRIEGNVVGTYDSLKEAILHYNAAKEKRVRATAEEYKGQIDPWVRTALLNWKVQSLDKVK